MRKGSGNKMKKVKVYFYSIIAFLIIPAFIFNNTYAQSNKNKRQNKTVKIFVEYRLAKDGLMDNNDLNVNVDRQTITLTGTVSTIADKKLAGKEAGDVNETYKVVNNLNIAASNDSAETIVKAVLKKIHDHVFYSVFDWVTASYKNGTLTLKGWVHQPWDVKIFQEKAEEIPGVDSVVNKIQKTFGPGNIGYRAAMLIYSDPMFEPYAYSTNPPIHIIVINGNVILKGHVDSSSLKYWAANMVRFKTDAISVNNQLAVKS